MLDQKEETREIMIIGVGGVYDQGGFERMKKVGAEAVAVATTLGSEGVDIFENILTTCSYVSVKRWQKTATLGAAFYMLSTALYLARQF